MIRRSGQDRVDSSPGLPGAGSPTCWTFGESSRSCVSFGAHRAVGTAMLGVARSLELRTRSKRRPVRIEDPRLFAPAGNQRFVIPGKRRAMVADSIRDDQDQVRNAISFIAIQRGGPQRILGHHRSLPSGLCGACSSVRHVRWPCPAVEMALQAEAQQRSPAPPRE